ncbi:MAG: glycosyltransferase family 4 protein [Planctomycetota bacterium]|nr:glycosyltransferase family 4 protein [Planctomycetota bacterium]MDA1211147.1 glycosyltransferase family 4 protein [Planctomycetota bacterium]
MIPPHVVIVCEYGTLNGGEQSLLSLLDNESFRSSSSTTPRVTLLAPADGHFADALKSRQLEHVPFRLTDTQGKRLPREQAQHHLVETLKSLSPQLVHANSLSMGRLTGSVRDQIEVPCVSHIRDIVGLSRAAVSDLNRLDHLIAVSQATRDFHVAQGVQSESIEVVYNGVDTAKFSPSGRTGDFIRERNLPADAFLVATIGQIGLRKGQDILADAAVRLRDRFPLVHYLIVGERNSTKAENRLFEENLHRLFAEAGLTSRVHFLGYRVDMPALLREIDVLVHPARQEPLGRVLLEAGAAGVPIIATHVGGTPEIFPNDEAVLIAPDNAQELADRLAELIRDESLRLKLGTAARRRISVSFSSSQAARKTLEIWKSYLDEGHS